MRHLFRSTAASLTVMLAAACPGPVTNGKYNGEPLVAIKGDLLSATTSTARPVRLAMVWSKYFPMAKDDNPLGIATEEVQFEGTFPLHFTFNLYEPPPEAMMTSPTEYPFRAAIGTLVAYQDENGNGALDIIPAGAAPIDTILGASDLYQLFEVGGDHNYSFVYLEGTPPPPGQLVHLGYVDLKAGFNLVKNQWAKHEIQPMTASVDIVLDRRPVLNALVCRELNTWYADHRSPWHGGCGLEDYYNKGIPWPDGHDYGFRPDDGGYRPNDGGYRPDDGGYRPNDGGYRPNDGGYRPDDGGYRPDDGGYRPDDGGGYWPDDGGVYRTDGGVYWP